MAKKLSRNAPCPCGSGKKYKHCCHRKEFDWQETDDGQIVRSVSISEETAEIIEDLRQAYVAQHGREPTRIFEGAPPLELMEHWTVEAMKKAGVEPALIYAYEQTNGLLLNDRNENKVPDSDIAQWEAAIDDYERKTGKRAMRRRLNDRDLEGMLQNGPPERPAEPARFVSRLPLTPPFSREFWESLHVSEIFDTPECFEYFEQCLWKMQQSERSETYLNLFLLMAHCKPGEAGQDYAAKLEEASNRSFSPQELAAAVESAVTTCQPQRAIPTAAAAFEFMGFIADFVGRYAEHIGAEDELADVLHQARGLTLFAFASAVNAELGVQEDAWQSR